MPSPSKTYRQLQPEDRVTLASLHQQGLGVRAIARVLQRSPATVSRELRRNACDGRYASAPAHGRAASNGAYRLVLLAGSSPRAFFSASFASAWVGAGRVRFV